MYTIPQHIDPSKIFLINRSKLEERFDPQFYNANLDFSNTIKLSEIAVIKGGKRIPLGYDYSTKETQNLYLRVANMYEGIDFDYNNFKMISDELYNILNKYEVFKNDLIISIAGSIGKVKLISNIPNNKKIILTENCAKILIKNKTIILPEYLLLLLQTSFLKRQIDLSYIQTTIPKLGLDRIGSLRLPNLPDLTTQQKLVDIYNYAYQQKQIKEAQAKKLLASIDSYLLTELGIRLPEEDNGLQARMFTLQFSEVTGRRLDSYYFKKEFIHFFDRLEESQHPIKSLKDISSVITSGITPKSGGDDYVNPTDGIPFIRSGNIDINGNLNFDDLLYISPEIHNTTMKSSKLIKNDLMIAIVGATIGQVGIYKDIREANINQAIALVRLKKGYNYEYIKETIKSSVGQWSLNRLKRPVARANINLEEISTLRLPIPPIEKQNEIANNIQSKRNQAKALQKEAEDILNDVKNKVEQMILSYIH